MAAKKKNSKKLKRTSSKKTAHKRKPAARARAGAKKATRRPVKKERAAKGGRSASASRTRRKAPAARATHTARSRSGSARKADVKGAAQRRAEALRRQLDRARVGTFEDLFANSTPELRSIGVKLRELIFEVVPDITETVYLGWKIALYKKESEICGIQPAGDRCNLYFTRGVFLLDPQGMLEGTGKRLRHVKVRSVVGIMAQGIRDLLKQASELPTR